MDDDIRRMERILQRQRRKAEVIQLYSGPPPRSRRPLARVAAAVALLLLPVSFGPGQDCHLSTPAPDPAEAVTVPAALPSACATSPAAHPGIGGLFGCATLHGAGVPASVPAAP